MKPYRPTCILKGTDIGAVRIAPIDIESRSRKAALRATLGAGEHRADDRFCRGGWPCAPSSTLPRNGGGGSEGNPKGWGAPAARTRDGPPATLDSVQRLRRTGVPAERIP